ncbi:MAG: ribonucleoside triphosphate reductase, partial [Spirochaetes bacterium]
METGASVVKQVVKRNGTLERYDRSKITAAIGKAINAVRGEADQKTAERLAIKAEEKLKSLLKGRHPNSAPAIEEIQDIVESVLIEAKEVDIAKAYIIY